MKKVTYIFNYFGVFIFYFGIISCSVSHISLDIVRPADIDVPNHMQDVLIVNRSLPEKSNQVENILDGILSGEGIGEDKKGSQKCVEGLNAILNQNINQTSRFNILGGDSFMSGDRLKGTGTSVFPKPIKWKKIKKLFTNYDIDGLIVLETFDSKSSTINAGVVEKIQFIKKKKTKVQLIEAILNIEIQAGWRIYDINNEKIIDEKNFIDQKSFSATDLTFEDAQKKLPSKSRAISETGFFAGEQYAYQITPKKDKVKRVFYKKAKNSSKKENVAFKNASNALKSNNIAKCASIWNDFVNHEDIEIAGRACFNMALACELKNNHNLAIDWIKKSIAYNNKKAIDYFTILDNRKLEIKKVEQQLKK